MRKIIMSTGLLVAVGCGPTIVVDGHKLDQHLYEAELGKVKSRAKFDLGCPVEKLETTVVATFDGSTEVSQFGVNGCDHRGTYVATPTGWVLNGPR